MTKLAMRFVCSRCWEMMEGIVDSIEKFGDEVDTVSEFCCLESRPNAIGGRDVEVTVRIRIDCARFKKCREIDFCSR